MSTGMVISIIGWGLAIVSFAVGMILTVGFFSKGKKKNTVPEPSKVPQEEEDSTEGNPSENDFDKELEHLLSDSIALGNTPTSSILKALLGVIGIVLSACGIVIGIVIALVGFFFLLF